MRLRIVRKLEYNIIHHLQRKWFGLFWADVMAGDLKQCKDAMDSMLKHGTPHIIVEEKTND